MIPILFVEDDPVVLANLRRVLAIRKREWEMRFVASGDEALVQLAKRPADVIVTDLSMPGMTGLELLAMVQHQHPRTVRVLLSEDAEADAAVRGAGVAHRILRKPFDPSELAIAVQRAYELEARLNDPDLQAMIAEIGVLPSPSASVVRLNDLLNDYSTTVDDVAELVGSDVGMTAKLLQVVNSAYFSLAHHVNDVREAITFLGLDTVRNLLVGMELLHALDNGSALVQAGIDEINERSLAVAHVARQLMPDRASANEAYVAGLLHDVGLLVIAGQMPDKFLQLRVRTMRSNLCLTEVEMEVVGAHHADIGAHLLDLWGLPYEIVEAVGRHHDAPAVPTTTLDSLHAVYIAHAIAAGETGAGDERESALEPGYLERLGVAERVFDLVSED